MVGEDLGASALFASAPFASDAEVNAAIYSNAFRKDATDDAQRSDPYLE
jgi:hypothetical protein